MSMQSQAMADTSGMAAWENHIPCVALSLIVCDGKQRSEFPTDRSVYNQSAKQTLPITEKLGQHQRMPHLPN